MNLKKLALIGSLGFMLVLNILAEALPLNGISTAAISDSFKVFFVPAGYVFAIWGVIYVTQIWFIYRLVKDFNRHEGFINKVLPWIVAGNIANGLWLIFWHALQIYITLPVMLVLLISLIMQFLAIYKYQERTMAFTIPIGIYIGWITVATVANITDVLYSLQWNGFGIAGQIWAAVLIVVAATLALLMLLKYRQIAYALVIVWSIIGIALKFPNEQWIPLAGTITAGIVFAVILRTGYKMISTKN